jgi:hypothetical protein
MNDNKLTEKHFYYEFLKKVQIIHVYDIIHEASCDGLYTNIYQIEIFFLEFQKERNVTN